jgi:DUF1980 C-terminal domain
MKKIGGVLEGLILLAIGLYASLLVFFGDYWRFLNPKFKWLTALAAIALMVLGVTATRYPTKRPKLFRIVIFLILLRVIAVAPSGISLAGHRVAVFGAAAVDKEKPRVTMSGREYVRINLAELYLHCDEAKNGPAAMRYAVRGIVKRDPRMDRLDQFAIVRNTVFCCLADSVGMGFRVQYDGRVDELTDGQWVEVYGTVRGTPETMPDLGLRIKGMNLTVLNETHILAADQARVTKEPEIPYIIDIRSTEPYAY